MSEPTPRAARLIGRRLLKTVAAAALTAALISTAACGGTKGGGVAATDTGTLFMGTVNPPAGFNPINQSDIAATWALSYEFDSLLVQPEPLDFQPKLADSFETEDDQTFTIKLNPKAMWSDGKPIVAQDVVDTLNLIAHPDSATALGANIGTLAGVDPVTGKLPKGESTVPGLKAVDDKTVELKTETPVDSNLIKELIGTKVPILPSHKISGIEPAKFGESAFAKMPDVTSGPFRIEKYTPNVSIEYVANDQYYLGKPKLKKLIMKVMPAANLAGELQTGSIQTNSAGGLGNIPIQDLETVKKMTDIQTEVSPTIGFQTVIFNNEVFTDKTMRQGLAHAVNRKQILDQLLKGNGEIIDGPYTSQSPYLDKSIKPIAYDPELAKKLIKESGWDMKKQIKFIVPTGNQIREQAADIMFENFKAVGLNVVMEKYDFPTVLAMEKEGKYDLGLVGLTFTVDPDVSSMYSSTGAFNLMNYDSKKSDQLLAAGKTEPDPEKRKKIYAELQKLWQDEMPVLTTYADSSIAAKNKSLTVGGPKPFWYGTTSDLEQWTFGGAQ